MRMKISLLLFSLLPYWCSAAPTVCKLQRENSAISILEYVKEQDDGFHLGSDKDVVLVLGITGNGKSTLSSLLTGAELEAIEIEGAEGSFRIEDKNDKISGVCGTTSKTITPNLMVDETNGVAFYDCPGFSDSRGVKVDMAATFATRKLMNYAESTKFLFTVSYTSIQVAIGDRLDFLELVRYATNLIKNLDKYHDAIALVVTKVPNNYVKKKGQLNLIDDNTIIESVATFLRQTKIDLQNKTLEAIDDGARETIARKILFIDILLEKKDDKYTRIGLFRLADEAGPLTDIPLIQEEKISILKMINEHLQYAPRDEGDFGYVISDKSKVHINDVIQELKVKLTDDFSVMSLQMKKYLLHKEKQSSNSLKESIESTAIIDQKLSKIVSLEPKTFQKDFNDVIDDLEMSLSTESLNKFSKYIEFLDFVQVFSTQNLTLPNEIVNQVTNLRTYLSNSNSWYNFLSMLRDKLSSYEVQEKVTDDTKLMRLSINTENEERTVEDLDIKSLMNGIDANIYSTIQNLQVNLVKLKLLQGVWRQSMQKISVDCSHDGKQLTVKGYNILTSDVIEATCWQSAKSIEIFALNKIFLDADIDKPSTVLSILAPVWEVVLNKGSPSRQINLNGVNAPEYDVMAKNGLTFPDPGEHGLPGRSGSRAGQFFGIGQTINEKKLNIQLIGGNGASGQNGGNGVDSIKGKELPFSVDISYLDSFGFHREHNSSGFGTKSHTYIYYGTDATGASDGGHGGCAGQGGNAGDSLILGFNEKSNIVVNIQTGINGTDGNGGLGGKCAENGRKLIVNLRRDSLFGSVHDEKAEYYYNGEKPAGKNGQTGKNCYEIKKDTFEPVDSMLTLNQYKYFAREHLANNIQMSELDKFIGYILHDESINSFYNVTSLMSEFESIESHYFKLRDKLSFIPYYESLRIRTAKNSREVADKQDEKKALYSLYTAIMSRIFAIRSSSNQVGVVDLLEYMNVVKKRMQRVQEVQKTIYINEYRDEYRSSLDAKIQMASDIIQNTIKPRIEDTFVEVDERIKELLNETFDKRDENRKELGKAREQQEILRKKMMAHKIMGPLKIVGASLSLLGPAGTSVGAAIPVVSDIAEHAVESALVGKKISVPSGPIKDEVFRIAKQAKRNFELLEIQMNDLNAILQNEGSDDFKSIAVKVTITVKEIKKTTTSANVPSSEQIKEIKGVPDDIIKLIDIASSALSSGNDKDKEATKAKIAKLAGMKKILKVGNAGLEMYQQIREDEEKMSEIDETISKIDNQLMVLDQFEQNIYNIMFPQLKLIQQSVTEAVKNGAGKSHVELDVSKWTIQSSLADVKKLFNAMTKDFTVSKDLERCIEKINEGITTVIDVYDRIDSYTEKAQLATLIADIAIGSNEIKDTQLKNAVSRTDRIIGANLVMEQYELAMQSLKQHKFPFAERYLGQFELPSNSSTIDVEFSNRAIDQMSNLILRIKESKSLIEETDGYLYDNHTFVDNQAFYKWNGIEYKDDIVQLLNGKDVAFVADINDGLKLNAIKFNEVWLKFNLKNETAQRQFENELKQFSIVLKIIGNSLYRCNKRFYYISLEKIVRISFSLESGNPTNRNAVYNKLKTGEPFLSPYTTWQIRLVPKSGNQIDFKKINKFKNDITDILLEGRGQYHEKNGKFLLEVCNNQLDKYYKFDSIDHTV